MTVREYRRIDQPFSGFFKRRTRSKGPWVPALVYAVPARDPETFASMDRAPTLACTVEGEERDLETEWSWLHGPITEREYLRLVAERVGVDDNLCLLTSPVRI